MNKKLYPLLIIAFLSSCYSYDSKSYQNQQGSSESITYQKTDHSFFWGLQEKESSPICNDDQTAKIESNNGFMNYFARIYTLGIYWPRTVEVECLGIGI